MGEYESAHLEMLAFIDRYPDLQETPAQFQERCGQIALKMFWNETHPEQAKPMTAAKPSRNGKHEEMLEGVG